MRVFILTLGTRGDFELFFGLARTLRQRGHGVVLGTSQFYARQTRDSGIEWVHIGQGTQDTLVSVLRSLAAVHDRAERTRLHATRWLRPQLAIARSQSAAAAATADYFVSNLKMVMQRGDRVIPGAFVTYDPPGDIADLARYGSQKYPGVILELVAMNKRLVDPQNLWGEQYLFTGFWGDDRAGAWEPPPALRAFLDEGPPAVVVTMGSMVMFDARKLLRDVSRALHLCGQRGIVVGGWSGLSEAETPGGPVRCVGEVPYDWLFPKASCVIHHGGCGTVAAVLRAGIPSILLPQIMCQAHFGEMLLKEHLAVGVYDTHTLDPAQLAAAIHRAVADERHREAARRWQQTISEERGVRVAADLIEEHWNRLQAAHVS